MRLVELRTKVILAAAAVVLACAMPDALAAQSGGGISGRVTDARTGSPVQGVEVTVLGTQFGSLTDSEGRYRIRSVRPGEYSVRFRGIGYSPQTRDSVLVSSADFTVLNAVLVPEAIELPDIVVEAGPDRLLDPKVTETVQSVSGRELRELPVNSVAEALVLQAGVVEGSYRGGRVGQESFVVDGLGVKNQLDASSGDIGFNIPTAALEEVTLITNGFSARYGQAISGIVTVSTRDGGDELEGTLAYETDRPAPDGWDVGLDRVVASVGGPLIGRIRFFMAADVRARIDDDPVNAPAPTDNPSDPRTDAPWLLPHNSGESYDLTAKLTIPMFGFNTLRILGVNSETRRLRYDPALKFAPDAGPAERLSGRLGLLHWQASSSPRSLNTTVFDVRVGYFQKEALRSALTNIPDRRFGAFTFGDFDFAGEALAESSDSLGALDAVQGFEKPAFADTPYGVPAFFTTADPRGDLRYNQFRELRTQADLLLGRGLDTDLRFGGEIVRQSVETFTRLEAFNSVDEGAPAPRLANFEPLSASGYAEILQRMEELSLTAGVRVDRFDARTGAETGNLEAKTAISPRFALSTELENATVVASIGRFAQAPDFQFLVDAAFEDTLRTGRFRQGNANLGFETSWQYEFNVRVRPMPGFGLRAGAFYKRLDGLVSSVPIGFSPDSSIFANADFGTVRGLEVSFERDFDGIFGARVSYALQDAKATASDAFDTFRLPFANSVGDTVIPASVEIPLDFDRRHAFIAVFRGRLPRSVPGPLRYLEAALVGRYFSGLPYSPTNLAGDSLLGFPNSARLPDQMSIDVLVRKSLRLGGTSMGLYVDVRNLTNRTNIVAVRRDTGTPMVGEPQLDALALEAYQAHPEPIPYESPRYDPVADRDGDGLIAGQDELLPLYRRAARDFLQPLFQYGPPRLVRFGVELVF